MRKVTLAATVILVAAYGCGDREQERLGSGLESPATPPVQEETAGAPEAPREFTFENRQDFAQSVRQQLAELDGQIDELSRQAKSKGGAVSDRALANIRAARRVVDRNLGRVDAASAEQWDDIRRGVDQAMGELSEAVERAYPK